MSKKFESNNWGLDLKGVVEGCVKTFFITQYEKIQSLAGFLTLGDEMAQKGWFPMDY